MLISNYRIGRLWSIRLLIIIFNFYSIKLFAQPNSGSSIGLRFTQGYGQKIKIDNLVGKQYLTPTNLNCKTIEINHNYCINGRLDLENNFVVGFQQFGFSYNLGTAYPFINNNINKEKWNKTFIATSIILKKKLYAKGTTKCNIGAGISLSFFNRIYIAATGRDKFKTDIGGVSPSYTNIDISNLVDNPFFTKAIIKTQLSRRIKNGHLLYFDLSFHKGLSTLFSGEYYFLKNTSDFNYGKWKTNGDQIEFGIGYAYLYNFNKKIKPLSYQKPTYFYLQKRNQFSLEVGHYKSFTSKFVNTSGNVNLKSWQFQTTGIGIGYSNMLNNKWGFNITGLMNLDQIAGEINFNKEDFDASVPMSYNSSIYLIKIDPGLNGSIIYCKNINQNFAFKINLGLQVRYFAGGFYDIYFGKRIPNTKTYLTYFEMHYDFYYEPEPKLLKSIILNPSISKIFKNKNSIALGLNLNYALQNIIEADYEILPDTKFKTTGKYIVDGHLLGLFLRYTYSSKRIEK